MQIIQHEGAWHIAKSTQASGDAGYSFTSWCGITAPWDNTFIDQMPSGGTGGACGKCRVAAGIEAAPEPKADLESMTKAELVAYAEEHGVEVAASALKADIIAAIEAAQ